MILIQGQSWCSSDKTTFEGKKLESLTSQCGFKQVLSDPTHILESSSSFIDLIFTSQPNLVTNSGVHSSLHTNCHNQIMHAKFNLNFSIHLHMNESSGTMKMQTMIKSNGPYPNSTGKELFLTRVLIRKFRFLMKLFLISWQILFLMKPKSLTIGSLLAEITKWKKWFKKKTKFIGFIWKKSNMLATKLEKLQNLIYETLESCKSKYYKNISKNGCSKAIAPKYYWSLLKAMLNDKKVPCIPPVFHDNKFLPDFSKKADLFNSFFAKQCSVIENNSVLPAWTIPVTDQYLANIEFMKDDIKRIICKLDPNKACGHDMIRIRM